MGLTRTAIIGAVALFLGACSSSVSVAPQMTRARSSISAAEAVGAKQDPRAALHLKMAQDQLKLAEQRIYHDEGEFLVDDDASMDVIFLLQRAEADAHLALVLARSSQAKQQAREASNRIHQLQLEME